MGDPIDGHAGVREAEVSKGGDHRREHGRTYPNIHDEVQNLAHAGRSPIPPSRATGPVPADQRPAGRHSLRDVEKGVPEGSLKGAGGARSITSTLRDQFRQKFAACSDARLVSRVDQVDRDDWTARDPLALVERPPWHRDSQENVRSRVGRGTSQRIVADEPIEIFHFGVALDLVEGDEIGPVVGCGRDAAKHDSWVVREAIAQTRMDGQTMDLSSRREVTGFQLANRVQAFPCADQLGSR